MATDDEAQKSLYIFGRDVSQIPCFRNTFLYGISGGFITGLATFLFTSRTRFATNVGFATFFSGTFIYWFSCRYEYSKKKFFYNQLQIAMKQQALYEGTEVEAEIERKSKEKSTLESC